MLFYLLLSDDFLFSIFFSKKVSCRNNIRIKISLDNSNVYLQHMLLKVRKKTIFKLTFLHNYAKFRENKTLAKFPTLQYGLR